VSSTPSRTRSTSSSAVTAQDTELQQGLQAPYPAHGRSAVTGIESRIPGAGDRTATGHCPRDTGTGHWHCRTPLDDTGHRIVRHWRLQVCRLHSTRRRFTRLVARRPHWRWRGSAHVHITSDTSIVPHHYPAHQNSARRGLPPSVLAPTRSTPSYCRPLWLWPALHWQHSWAYYRKAGQARGRDQAWSSALMLPQDCRPRSNRPL